MGIWTIAQLVVFAVAIVLVIIGNKLSLPLLTYSGGVLFGVTSLLIGIEAILTRRIVLGRRRYNETYTGIAAYAQGVQFSMLAMFIIGASIAAYLNTGDTIFNYFIRRPGLLLITFGIYCLLQAIIAIAGYQEEKQGPGWIVIMNLFTGRLLPGVILIVIGLGALGLGLFEVIAPQAFDKMGGEFLEMLFGVR